MKERHKLIGAVYLILKNEDQVLLSRRANTGWYDGEYGLPSGHLEQGETFAQGIIREATEEIGIFLDPQDIRFVHLLHRQTCDYVDVFFQATKWRGSIRNCEPEKCDDLSWFTLEQLPTNLVPDIANVLGQLKNNAYYSQDAA